MDPSKLNVYRSLIREAKLPGSVKEFICFSLAEYGSELVELIKNLQGEKVMSINDINLSLPATCKFGHNVIEISNSWVEEQFIFIKFDEFEKLISILLEGDEVRKVDCISATSHDRHDYDEMRNEW